MRAAESNHEWDDVIMRNTTIARWNNRIRNLRISRLFRSFEEILVYENELHSSRNKKRVERIFNDIFEFWSRRNCVLSFVFFFVEWFRLRMKVIFTQKDKIESKFERLVLIVKKFQNEILIVKTAIKKYEVCQNIIINKNRIKRIMFEFFMNRQLLVSHEETIILKFVNKFIALSFFLRLLMMKEKIELILRKRRHNVNLRMHWIDRFLIKHSEYRAKFSRHLDQERYFNFDRDFFQKWFELFQKTCQKYDIVCENIYNMNKKNYMMKINDKIKWVLHFNLI
jgi:hypothetical protein